MPKLTFGGFELDPSAGELRRRGRLIALGPQPFRLLALLASRARRLVTREEIQHHLWADGTSVDFDHGVNACVRQVRLALGDRASRPRYIETVPRRGYRFVSAVRHETGRHPRATPADLVVGRAKTLEALAAAYQQVLSQRRGQVVCLAGEPGIGKTTAAELFLARDGKDGRSPTIGRGRCSESLAGSSAYLPWFEALEELTAIDATGTTAAMLHAIAPAWYRLVMHPHVPAGEDSSGTSPQSPEQLKRELVSFLTSVTADRPVIIWFEDLHWADASTVDLIAYVASRFDELALMMLVTFRDTELKVARHPFVALRLELESRGQCHTVPLPFLAREDVQAYLAEAFPGHVFPPELAGLLHAHTEGSPLFVVNAVSYLRARQSIALEDGCWSFRGALQALDDDLPPSVLAMIERKLSLVHHTADRHVLDAATVMGHDFDSTTVADALERDPVDVEASLDRLSRVHALIAVHGPGRLPDGTPTLRCRFVHVLYQNVLSAELSPTRRARLCRRSADVVRRRYLHQVEPVAALLARLYEEAGEPSEAIAHYLVAARHALRLFASHEVVALAESGLRLLPLLGTAAERLARELELRLTLAPALTTLQGWAAEALRENYARAQQLCEQSPHPNDVLLPLMGLATFHHVRANFAESGRLARHVLSLAESGADRVLVCMAVGNLAAGAFHLARLAESRSLLARMLDEYDPASQRDLLIRRAGMDSVAVGVAYLAYLDLIEGHPDASYAHLERAVAFAGSHPFTLAVIPAFGVIMSFSADRPDEVERHAQAVISASTEHGFTGQLAFGTFFLGWAKAIRVGGDEGFRMMDEAERVLAMVGNDVFLSLRHLALAEAHFRTDHLEAARRALDHMRTFIERSGERTFEPELHRLLGRMAASEGDAAAAEAAFRSARATARRLGTALFEARAEAALDSMQKC